jgi:hypothetical protein
MIWAMPGGLQPAAMSKKKVWGQQTAPSYWVPFALGCNVGFLRLRRTNLGNFNNEKIRNKIQNNPL